VIGRGERRLDRPRWSTSNKRTAPRAMWPTSARAVKPYSRRFSRQLWAGLPRAPFFSPSPAVGSRTKAPVLKPHLLSSGSSRLMMRVACTRFLTGGEGQRFLHSSVRPLQGSRGAFGRQGLLVFIPCFSRAAGTTTHPSKPGVGASKELGIIRVGISTSGPRSSPVRGSFSQPSPYGLASYPMVVRREEEKGGQPSDLRPQQRANEQAIVARDPNPAGWVELPNQSSANPPRCAGWLEAQSPHRR
jgi:hypothetical protein